MEYASFVWGNIPNYLWNRLETMQNRAVRIAMGYRGTTPINVILAEACIPRMVDRADFLGMNYITNVMSRDGHELIPILEGIQNYINDPTSVAKITPPLLYECFNRCDGCSHLVFKAKTPLHCLRGGGACRPEYLLRHWLYNKGKH